MSSRLLTSFALIAALLAGGCDRGGGDAAQQQESSPDAKAVSRGIDRSHAGSPLPDATLALPDGSQTPLTAFEGQPVLINLWATWCAPCVREMPLLDEVAADYGSDLNVITISQDMGDPIKVAAFFEENGLENLPQWIDPQLRLGEAVGAETLPTTVLYDRTGQEVWRVTGDFDWSSDVARAAIEEVVETPELP